MAQTVAMFALVVVLAVGAYTDVRRGLIYNWLTYPAMLLGLLIWTVFGWVEGGSSGAWSGLGSAMAGLAAGLVPFIILAAYNMIGAGDAKLMGVVGALTASWQCVVTTVFYTCIAALLMAVAVMVARGIVRRTLQRVFALLVAKAAGVQPPESDDSPKLPYGLALKVGAIVAATEHLLRIELPWSHLNTML